MQHTPVPFTSPSSLPAETFSGSHMFPNPYSNIFLLQPHFPFLIKSCQPPKSPKWFSLYWQSSFPSVSPTSSCMLSSGEGGIMWIAIQELRGNPCLLIRYQSTQGAHIPRQRAQHLKEESLALAGLPTSCFTGRSTQCASTENEMFGFGFKSRGPQGACLRGSVSGLLNSCLPKVPWRVTVPNQTLATVLCAFYKTEVSIWSSFFFQQTFLRRTA